MAASLPGCPIVGFFDEAEGDFTGHQRSIEVGDGKFRVIDKTKAYGYVDSSAKIWFQKFMDDGIEHEYLMTEGFLWTSIYKEAEEIMHRPKNQSMELHEENLKGSWTFDDNGFPKFFIINEAMIQKLCILGENVEPCFEGAGIAAQFSFDGDFKNKLFSLIEDIKIALNKGGLNPMDDNKMIDPTLDSTSELEYKKKDEEEDKKNENNPFPPKKDDGEKDDTSNDESDSKEEDEEEDKKKKAPAKHSLTDEEIASTELYKTLFSQFQDLQKKMSDLEAEIAPLREFKNITDRKAKEDMINSFYMLSNEDKKDCIDNIDTYSLDTIEAKLSIICVRNKVSFNLDDDKKQEKETPTDPLVYQLGDNDDGDSAPAWIKAVRETAKEMN